MVKVAGVNNNNDCLSPHGLWGVKPENLFINHSLLATHNPRQARASVEEVFCKHRLRTCNKTNPVNFVHRGANLSSLTFNLISYGADVEVSVDEINRSHYIIVVPLTGQALVQNGNEYADLSRGSMVVLDPVSPFKFEMGSDHSHLAIGIPKQRLNLLFSKYSQQLGRQWIEFERRPYQLKNIGEGLPDFIEYICNEIDRPGTIVSKSVVASSIEETFLTVLISSLLQTGLSNESVEKVKSAVPRCVQKAEQFMEMNLVEDIHAQDIVEAAGVPMRTLYHTYRKCRGVSPVHWLKIRRLRQARFDLLDPAQCDTPITEIACRYQQYHLGRFSKAYFQEFGECPSVTRKG